MLDVRHDSLNKFVGYVSALGGDEKGEAQVFLDRLFQAFGHAGYKEAGATLESRVRAKDKSTRFADLLWAPRVLIEMKKRGQNLALHYDQARDYWHDTYPKPRYVVLCNFDEFWVYDFFNQSDPVDTVRLKDLPQRYLSLAFLFPEEVKPQFGNDRVAVSRKAADAVARVFNSLIARGEDRARAQRFILQCVFCLFAEDFNLLPKGLFSSLIADAVEGENTFDLFGQLFRQMDSKQKARGGRFKDVDYFDGGLFAEIDPIDLIKSEIHLLEEAAKENWSLVQPAVFGALFEGSMGKEERHAFGAHFTSEADIMKIVRPTIERPWMERIDAAKTLKELNALRDALLNFRVLDPACGCGNFLYVAYREMRRLEMRILTRIHAEFGWETRRQAGTYPRLSLIQFYGIDINSFAVELAKVTLMLGREQGIEETRTALASGQLDLPLDQEPMLPLDNLDENIIKADALFYDWPKTDVIIGNPPFMDARKFVMERGDAEARRIRNAYPMIPGRANLCVYWFRKTHDHLIEGQRAGLVGTNSIRQNYSREGGLDYIVSNMGVITDAVKSQVWSGEAAVHVSIVNWIKGDFEGACQLTWQIGDSSDSPWKTETPKKITSSLSAGVDVAGARTLVASVEPFCFEGIQPGHRGFRLTREERQTLLAKEPKSRYMISSYMNGEDLLSRTYEKSPEYLIDFNGKSMHEAMTYTAIFDHLKHTVLPDWSSNAAKEKDRTKKDTGEHQNRLKTWWQLKRPRLELQREIRRIPRYIVCSRVTKRPIFEFLCRSVKPDSSLTVFTAPDDYSFGIIQSGTHWEWFIARCSTLTERFRYTSNSVFDTFPWPQSPTLKQAQAVAKAAVELRAQRRRVMAEHGWSLRDLYRTLDIAGKNPLRDWHEALDAAVRAAYGMKKNEDMLAFLLRLNHEVAEREGQLQPVTGPGLPPCVKDPKPFITKDCISVE